MYKTQKTKSKAKIKLFYKKLKNPYFNICKYKINNNKSIY